MVENYNAFISYRHSEKDSAIAAEVQHQLEHFHIPKVIQKATGIKRISRIFRDKEELPITSDLNNDIGYALEHSGFLIVICSTSTRESLWVPREIETFLKYHTRERILTVLVDGEPGDVIPELLLHEDSTPIEPLSCDYRLPLKKARKEELPRLAASLLGCSYDELVLRQRQYRIHRMMSILAATLTASVIAVSYLLWSGLQIRSNYQKSLENQSRYLANESLNALEDKDRIMAAQLALAALPSAQNSRPVIPEAEYALGRSIDAYQVPQKTYVSSTWKFDADKTIKKYFTSDDGSILFAVDSSNTVYAWNIETHKQLFSHTFKGNNVDDILNTGASSLTIVTSSSILCYDTKTFKTIWEKDVTFNAPQSYHCALYAAASNTLIVSESKGIHIADLSDGNITKDISITDFGSSDLMSVNQITLSPDGTTLSAEFGTTDNAVKVGIYHLASGKAELLPASYVYISSRVFADNGCLYLTVFNGDINKTSSSYNNVNLLYDSKDTIICYDPAAGKIVWKTDIPSQQVAYETAMLQVPFTDLSQKKHNAISVCISNLSVFVDETDGKILDSVELPASFISANTTDDYIQYTLEDGETALYYLNRNTADFKLYSREFYMDHVGEAVHFTNSVARNAGILVQPHAGSDILLFHSNFHDEDWTALSKDSFVKDSIGDSIISDRYLAVIPASKSSLHIYDLHSRKENASMTLDEGNSYRLLGYNDDQTQLLLLASETSDSVIRLLHISTADASVISTSELSGNEFLSGLMNQIVMQNGNLYFHDYDKDMNQILCIYSISTAKTQQIKIADSDSTDSSNIIKELYPSADGSKVFCSFSDDSGVIVDTASQSVVKPALTGDSTAHTISYAAWSDDGSILAISDPYNIFLLNAKGELHGTISCDGLTASSIAVHDDMVIVLYSNGEIYRYSAADGSFLGETDGMVSSSILSDTSCRWTFTDDTLYLQNGYIMNIINTDSWTMSAYFNYCLGYCGAEDIFCAYSADSDMQVGYFPHYTTDDLIRKAKDMLSDQTELNAALKSKYGID